MRAGGRRERKGGRKGRRMKEGGKGREKDRASVCVFPSFFFTLAVKEEES